MNTLIQTQKLRSFNTSKVPQVSQPYYTPLSVHQKNQSVNGQHAQNRVVHLVQNNNDNRLSRSFITHQKPLPNIRLLQNSEKTRVGSISQKLIRHRQAQSGILTHSSPSSTHTRVIQVPTGYRLVSSASSSSSLSAVTRREMLLHQHNNGETLKNTSVNQLRHIQSVSATANSRLMSTGTPAARQTVLANHHAAIRGNLHNSNLRSGYYSAGIKVRPLAPNNNKNIINVNGGCVRDTMVKKVLYRQNIPLYATSAQQSQQHNIINPNQRVSCANRMSITNRLIPSISSPQLLPTYQTRLASPVRPPSVPPPELQPQSPVCSPTSSPSPILSHAQLVYSNQPLKQFCRNVSPTTYINNENAAKKLIKTENIRNLNNALSEFNEKDSSNKLTEEDEVLFLFKIKILFLI